MRTWSFISRFVTNKVFVVGNSVFFYLLINVSVIFGQLIIKLLLKNIYISQDYIRRDSIIQYKKNIQIIKSLKYLYINRSIDKTIGNK